MSRSIRLALLAVLAAALLGAVAAGCGETDHEDLVEGETFELGELRYNVLFTRTLNPSQVEDAEYLVGQQPAPQGKEYLGVFMLVDNLSDDPHDLPKKDEFEVTDTSPNQATYLPLESASAFIFPFGEVVEGDRKVPDPDSVAAAGPTQGSLLLYLVDENVTENRPLDLHIKGQEEEATIELDI